jgi:two-component system, chemotaxis family, protein-glutamate methylesterase/glutaminase
MPLSAVNNLKVDYCVPIAEMAGLIEKLVGQAPSRQNSVPVEVKVEALIAERVLSDVAQVSTLGKQVPYNCPNCGGVLWEMAASDAKRYRCHTGHSFTAPSLLTSQTERIEETLWVSLRMFEERKNLLTNMAHQETAASRKRSYTEQAKATEIHIERIRAMLKAAPPQVTERKF